MHVHLRMVRLKTLRLLSTEWAQPTYTCLYMWAGGVLLDRVHRNTCFVHVGSSGVGHLAGVCHPAHALAGARAGLEVSAASGDLEGEGNTPAGGWAAGHSTAQHSTVRYS
jgi:hypothetical protein